MSEENARDHWVGRTSFFSFLLKLSLACFNFAFVFGDGFGVGSNGLSSPRAESASQARALRALGLLLADGTPTVGGGKTF